MGGWGGLSMCSKSTAALLMCTGAHVSAHLHDTGGHKLLHLALQGGVVAAQCLVQQASSHALRVQTKLGQLQEDKGDQCVGHMFTALIARTEQRRQAGTLSWLHLPLFPACTALWLQIWAAYLQANKNAMAQLRRAILAELPLVSLGCQQEGIGYKLCAEDAVSLLEGNQGGVGGHTNMVPVRRGLRGDSRGMQSTYQPTLEEVDACARVICVHSCTCMCLHMLCAFMRTNVHESVHVRACVWVWVWACVCMRVGVGVGVGARACT